jgi:hypothetical protein
LSSGLLFSLGLANIEEHLRSVLHHPFGLPLAWFLSTNDDRDEDSLGRRA